jgi:mono/diheme cytochrome c family protein
MSRLSPASRRILVRRDLRLMMLSLLCVKLIYGALSANYAWPMTLADPPEERTAGPAESDLYFEKHVRPILKAHCFQCHGEEPEPEGGLDIRLVRLMSEGGYSGAALVAGEPHESLIWQRIADEEMPPGEKQLSEADKQTILSWIRQGVRTARPEPEDPDAVKVTQEELSHWSFQPITRPQPPYNVLAESADAGNQAASPIDAFVGESLQAAGLEFNPPADRRTLIRRLSIDLHGLPPTPAEVAEFLADDSPDAYRRLVGKLLDSPRYGVRWGRHWLDAVGYAESDGNIPQDQPRAHAWHYRDYVIEAFNDDKPYDQFIVEQLAGDELIAGQPDSNNPRHVELLAATGMLRMPPDVTQTNNSLLDRNQAVADMLSVFGTSVLGVTVGCAQCHDHRYDPIPIEDYYRLRAVFDPAFPLHQWKQPRQRLIDMTDDKTRERAAEIEAEAVAVEEDINRRRREHCQGIQDREIDKVPEERREAVRTAIGTQPSEQTDEQKKLLDRFPKVRTVDWIIGQLIEYDREAYDKFEKDREEVDAIRETKPLERMIMAVEESSERIPESRVFFRGSPESPTESVEPAELTALAAKRNPVEILVVAEADRLTTGRRLAYARQLTDGSHPTLARVIVNRVWMHHFGQGLVLTPGDFGLDGEPPSHPALLDWLASDFMDHGWSVKRLHRQILLSRTYRQASGGGASLAAEIDPENRWLSRMNLRRLDAESIRDAVLLVSGQLNEQLGGPSVPVAEDGEGKAVIGKRLKKNGLFSGVEEVGGQANRRSLFITTRRDLPLNLLQTFDLPEMNPSCQRRDSSTVASQALFFLNDSFIVDATGKMADHLWRREEGLSERVSLGFEACFSQPPSEAELADSLDFLRRQTEIFAADPSEAWQERLQEDHEAAERRALASLCQVLMSSNRFLYVQ